MGYHQIYLISVPIFLSVSVSTRLFFGHVIYKRQKMVILPNHKGDTAVMPNHTVC